MDRCIRASFPVVRRLATSIQIAVISHIQSYSVVCSLARADFCSHVISSLIFTLQFQIYKLHNIHITMSPGYLFCIEKCFVEIDYKLIATIIER